jgi:hypothetical protein
MGAITYFFFGDNDYTARLSPALYSIALGNSPLTCSGVKFGRTGSHRCQYRDGVFAGLL